jgi:signal transduction histidine kinase
MTRLRLSRTLWFYPLVGALLGCFYVLLDEGILDQTVNASPALDIMHEFVDAIFPVLFGIAAGIAVNLFQKQLRINRSLSLKKDKLERELLLSMLISQILHEIQNPLHNISAAFETNEELTSEKKQIIKRNLDRLAELKKKYGGWEWSERFDPEEPLLFRAWLETWLADKMGHQLSASNVQYSSDIKNVKIFAHPVLVERIFLTLFENAMEAMERSDAKGTLRVEASEEEGSVLIRILNNGSPFPDEALKAQGNRPVQSRHGLGLGLLLANKILEQIGGKLKLSNEGGTSVVTLTLPGRSA